MCAGNRVVADVPWTLLKFASNSKRVAGQYFQTSAKSIKTLPLAELVRLL